MISIHRITHRFGSFTTDSSDGIISLFTGKYSDTLTKCFYTDTLILSLGISRLCFSDRLRFSSFFVFGTHTQTSTLIALSGTEAKRKNQRHKMGLIINILLLKSQITVAAVSATPWPTETWLLAPLAYPFLNYGYEKKKYYNILAFEVYLIQERLTSDHPASKNAFIAKGKGYKIPLSELSPFRLLWVISS